MQMPILHANANLALGDPVIRAPRLTETKKLYLALISATAPSIALDAHILCWTNGFTMHANANPELGPFRFFDAKAITHECGAWPMYTGSLTEVLSLVTQHAPDLKMLLGRYEDGRWTLGWSSDMTAPKSDGSVFDEAFLPIAAMAALLEALIERQKVQQ